MRFDLKEKEQIKSINRKHPLTFALSFLVGIFLIVAPFFFIIPLWRMKLAGYIIFGSLIFLGTIFFLKGFVNWCGNILLITNQRLILIERRGFFNEKIQKIGYEQIRTVEVTIQGIFQTLFKCGTLHVRMIESPSVVKFTNLPNPTRIQELIIRLEEKFKREKKLDEMNYEELVKTAYEIRDRIGHYKFREIAEEEKEPPVE